MFNFVKDGNQLAFLVFAEVVWELDVELDYQVASLEVSFDWAQGVVVHDWHSFALNYFEGVGVDYVVAPDLDDFVFHGRHIQCTRLQGIK